MGLWHPIVDRAQADGEWLLVGRLLAGRGGGDLVLRPLEVAAPLEPAEEAEHGHPPEGLHRGGQLGRHRAHSPLSPFEGRPHYFMGVRSSSFVCFPFESPFINIIITLTLSVVCKQLPQRHAFQCMPLINCVEPWTILESTESLRG